MIKVYLASPYTLGDVAVNIKTQMDVANELISLGFAPFVPLYSHFQHMAHPRPYGDWLKLDLEWLSVCDCLLAFLVNRKAPDSEVEFAKLCGMPVFYSLEELIKWKHTLPLQ